jgi:hypothetical protein
MIKELTRDVSLIDSIGTVIKAGAQEALIGFHEAKKQADAKVRHFFDRIDAPVKIRQSFYNNNCHFFIPDAI